jgi:hypothetical protein
MARALVLEGTWDQVRVQFEQAARGAPDDRVQLIVLTEEPAASAAPDEHFYDRADRDEWIYAFDAIAAKYRHLPVLPSEAYDREHIYEGRV